MNNTQHIENIVIGQPLVNLSEIFSEDIDDWNSNESDKTYYTNERYLPRILVDLGVYPSISEIKRNKPELVCTLDKLDFLMIRPKKKIPLWILVGE